MADVTKDPATAEETSDTGLSEAQIAVHWREEEYYPPPKAFKEQANANDKSILERFAPDRRVFCPGLLDQLFCFQPQTATEHFG